MTKKFYLMSLLLTLLALPFALTSCGDDDEPDNNTIYDFSIVWDVVDNGDYTTAQAMSIAAGFTEASEYIFEECTTAEAKEYFERFCNQMRYEFRTGYQEITLTARLVNTETNKTVSTKTFYIKPDGTTLNAPAMNSVIVTVE